MLNSFTLKGPVPTHRELIQRLKTFDIGKIGKGVAAHYITATGDRQNLIGNAKSVPLCKGTCLLSKFTSQGKIGPL
jgi:hypothetical protein